MQPAEIAALSAELTSFTARRWQQLQDEIDATVRLWPSMARHARLERLTALQAVVADLRQGADAIARVYATEGLHSAYTLGAAAAGMEQFTAVDVDALGVLAQDTYSNLLDATRHVEDTAKQLIRYLTREHVADRLLGGQTAADSARALAADLKDRGISAITYKDGSRHGLADYTEMLTRTQSALAYSTATINGAKSSGVGYLEVFDGFDCGLSSHADAFKPNGMVLPVDVCETYTLSHPRCQRAYGPRPDVTSDQQAADSPPTQTAAQAADQQQVSIQRAQRVQDRARRLAARNAKLAARTGA